MPARAGDDRPQVEPVRRTVAGVVLLEPGRAPLEQPDGSGAVAAGGVREADAGLRETLPQVEKGLPSCTRLRANSRVSNGGSGSSETGSTPAAP